LTFYKCKEGGNFNSQTVSFSADSTAVAGNISFTETANTSGGTFDYSHAVFSINIDAPVPVDTTAPVITPHISGTLGLNGWYVSDVTVSWTIVDNESSFTSNGCDETTISDDTAGIAITCTATSLGGTNTSSVSLKRDATAPTIYASATTLPNMKGWYNSDVTVHFICADDLSGIPDGSCPVDQILSLEGASISSLAKSVSDAAGNNSGLSNIVTVKIDKTAPALAPVVTPNPVILNGDASVEPNASDLLSGLASVSCDPVDTSNVGINFVTCTAIDNADNKTITSASYNVKYHFLGFFQPIDNAAINIAKSGSTIPVKWALTDANGNYIFDLSAFKSLSSRIISCNSGEPTDVIEETISSGGSVLRYDISANQFIYNWATIKSWSGTCRRISLSLNDGVTYIADFRFR